MRRYITLFAILILFLSGCSSNRLYINNSDVIAYYINYPIHYDNRDTSVLANKPPYSMDLYLGDISRPPRVLCRATIENVQNNEVLFTYEQQKDAPKESDPGAVWLQHSIVTALVDKVFFDPRQNPVQQGDRVIIYSTNNEFWDQGKPVFEVGHQYYITMMDSELAYPPSRDESFFASSFYRQISDFYCVACEEYRWRIDKNERVYAVTNLFYDDMEDTIYTNSCWYDVFEKEKFEEKLIVALAPYIEKWENEEILDYVESRHKKAK